MTITAFIGLATLFSVVTSLCMEAAKKILDDMNLYHILVTYLRIQKDIATGIIGPIL